jgi:CDP-glycerol glycerophosphotransferase
MCAKTLAPDRRALHVRTLHSTAICGYRRPQVVRLLSRWYDLTVACSEPVADAYREFMSADNRIRLITVPNGAVMLDAVPDMEAKLRARQALNIPQQAFVVAHIGRLHGTRRGSSLESEPKAQDVLLEAFAKVFRGDTDAALVLVGDGPLREEAKRLAETLGVTNLVHFLNQEPEPWPALTAADLFCFPSRYEGLPLVLLEAASCGLPIVASDIPEIRGLYPGDAWTLAPVNDVSRFADAMLHVRANLRNFAMRAHAAAPGFREKYSMRDCAKRYLAVYQAELEGRHSVD